MRRKFALIARAAGLTCVSRGRSADRIPQHEQRRHLDLCSFSLDTLLFLHGNDLVELLEAAFEIFDVRQDALLDVDAELLGVGQITRLLAVDKHRHAAHALTLRS